MIHLLGMHEDPIHGSKFVPRVSRDSPSSTYRLRERRVTPLLEIMKLFLVIRTVVGSQWSCRRLVGENQGIGPLNPAGWNGHIALAQPRERRHFVLAGHE